MLFVPFRVRPVQVLEPSEGEAKARLALANKVIVIAWFMACCISS